MTSIVSIHAYLDTSILGGYFDVEFAEATRRLFQAFDDRWIIPYLGQQTMDELAGAPAEVVALLPLIPGDPEILPVDVEVMALADAYLKAQALPSRSVGDAVHVATAVVHGIPLLLSWNFKHLANVRRNRAFNAVNLTHGYAPVEIRSPPEVIENDQDAIHD